MSQENSLPPYQKILEHKDGVFQGLSVAFALLIEQVLTHFQLTFSIPTTFLSMILGFSLGKLVEFFITRMRTSYVTSNDLDRTFKLINKKYNKLRKHIDERITRLEKDRAATADKAIQKLLQEEITDLRLEKKAFDKEELAEMRRVEVGVGA